MSKTESRTVSPGYKAPAIRKAFHLLRKVSESPQKLNITELALQLGYSKSTTHGLVHALLREGALAKGAKGRKLYLGPAMVDLAFSNWNYIKMVISIQPVIDALRDRIGETTVLGALINHRVLIMATAESEMPLKISATPGTILPLFAGAAGKAFHAVKTTASVSRLILEKGLPRHTPKSIVIEEKYLEELEQVRRRGYALDLEEFMTGVNAVAMALNNLKGPPLAVWVVGLSSSLGTEKIRTAIEAMGAEMEKLRAVVDKTTG